VVEKKEPLQLCKWLAHLTDCEKHGDERGGSHICGLPLAVAFLGPGEVGRGERFCEAAWFAWLSGEICILSVQIRPASRNRWRDASDLLECCVVLRTNEHFLYFLPFEITFSVPIVQDLSTTSGSLGMNCWLSCVVGLSQAGESAEDREVKARRLQVSMFTAIVGFRRTLGYKGLPGLRASLTSGREDVETLWGSASPYEYSDRLDPTLRDGFVDWVAPYLAQGRLFVYHRRVIISARHSRHSPPLPWPVDRSACLLQRRHEQPGWQQLQPRPLRKWSTQSRCALSRLLKRGHLRQRSTPRCSLPLVTSLWP
jgi:hypothetical protein